MNIVRKLSKKKLYKKPVAHMSPGTFFEGEDTKWLFVKTGLSKEDVFLVDGSMPFMNWNINAPKDHPGKLVTLVEIKYKYKD